MTKQDKYSLKTTLLHRLPILDTFDEQLLWFRHLTGGNKGWTNRASTVEGLGVTPL